MSEASLVTTFVMVASFQASARVLLDQLGVPILGVTRKPKRMSTSLSERNAQRTCARRGPSARSEPFISTSTR